MAITLVLETGSGLNVAANTFAELADANTYNETLIESAAWDGEADDDQKNRALAQASRILTNHWRWTGVRAQPATQPLAWPRDEAECDGVEIDDDVVPTLVFQATCEIARDLITAGAFQTRPINTGGADQLKSIGVGKGAVELEYQDAGPIDADNIVSPYVIQMLACLGRFQGRGRFRGIPLVR